MVSSSTRRRYLLTLGAVGTTGLAGCGGTDEGTPTGASSTPTATERDSNTGWKMYGANPSNTGTVPGATGPTESVTEEWTFEAISGFGGVAVVDGTVYGGTGAQEMKALDADDGTERWSFLASGWPNAAPAVVDGTVYFAASQGSGEGTNVYACATSDGTKQWQAKTDYGTKQHVTVAEDTVFVGDGTYDSDDGGNLYAFSTADGTERWRLETTDEVFTPAVQNGTVYVATDADGIYALTASDGAEQWHLEENTSPSSPPTVVDDTIYVDAYGGSVSALSASDGSEQWRYQTGYNVFNPPAVADGRVYITDEEGDISCVDAADGTEQWTVELGKNSLTAPAVADGTVYVGRYIYNPTDGYLYALDTSDGTQLWEYEVGDEPTAPAVVDGTVYFGGGNDTMFALTES